MNKLLTYNSFSDKDLVKHSLTCGIEIHQQLDTKKLFSKAVSAIVPNEKLDKEIRRRLRFSASETGEFDAAALHEFKKEKEFVYRYNNDCASLVELDEEPPIGPDTEALWTSLGICKMLNAEVLPKLQFMRKLIIDGSITSGFQRTAMIGLLGHVETSFGKVRIHSLNLEEDSSRIIEKNEKEAIYSLDRQGIPLVEITTAPDMHEPEQVYECALQLGTVLRSFEKVKRGLGTIRQDLNVSVKEGARVEIKGAQNLKLIPDIVRQEAARQLVLFSIIQEFKSRYKQSLEEWKAEALTQKFDISDILKSADSKIVQKNLEEKDACVLALRLPALSGLLGHEIQPNYRFASEISLRNKQHFPHLKGLFHTDELPKYGIEEEHVRAIKEKLSCKENDAALLLVGNRGMIEASLENIVEITASLLEKVSSEVRQVDPKGTQTVFLRPMPGAARMYPETDIVELSIEKKKIDELALPELYNKKLERLNKEFSLEENKTKEFLEQYSEEEIKQYLSLSSKNAAWLYSVLFDIPKDIRKRDKVELLSFKEALLIDLFKTVKEKDLDLKVIRDIFLSLYKDKILECDSLKDYLDKKELLVAQLSDEELREILKKVVEENTGAPFGALMGHAVKSVGGRADGKRISETLKSLM
ncbi:Glu-tRNA(Gln) amidotransferase subunit GatE [Candidatus Woesearchaeota archaeon]|nr:Glu-tRNA(Gln) amidotransferase subunit GatE [Nanoarchaeota archaeon]MCB9370285.1 Glu-tRNA(Gln) amidotransferase subunit GatE [Candidatus Woesearchaeota archaeon]USN44810.1 MAG: Glu-tRNA(Gln) amidotransferase subunit GatE [Candidatus Woesearchaeota archaeon]